MTDAIDGRCPQPLSGLDTSGLSARVFSDPADFLKTLHDGFPEIARGKDQLTWPDLRDAIASGSSEKLRAASILAADHMEDLGGISKQAHPYGEADGSAITKKDLDFAIAMNDHQTAAYTFPSVAMDCVVSALGIGASGVAASVGRVGLAKATGVFGRATTFGFFGVAAAGLGLAAVAGYEAYTEGGRMHKIAATDSNMFKSWISS
jgi:hypothetical protein